MQWMLDDHGLEGGDPSRVNPYAQWEPLQRRPALRALPGPRYIPVYIRLTADAQAQASRLLAHDPAMQPFGAYLLDTVGAQTLDRLIQSGDTERFGGLFLYCPAEEPVPTPPAGVEICFVGPALALPVTAAEGAAAAPAVAPEITEGVVTAVIDDFIAFANDRFCRGAQTRIAAIWGQDHPQQAKGRRIAFGGTLTAGEIDTLRQSSSSEDALYRAAFAGPALRGLGKGPSHDAAVREALYQRPFGYPDAHGTHVLDLAAGNPADAAPSDRPILAVQLPQLATAETWGARLEHFILIALQQILLWSDMAKNTAGETTPAPCVINVSYAVQAGLKDGNGFLAREMARLIAARNTTVATRLVLAAGNSFRARCHAEGEVAPGESVEFAWRLLPQDHSDNFLEIIAAPAGGGRLHLSLPQGAPPLDLPFKPGLVAELRDGATIVARATVLAAEEAAARVVLAMAPTQNLDDPERVTPAGDVTVSLHAARGTTLHYAADVQRDDTPTSFPRRGRQSFLETPGSYAVDPVTLQREAPTPDDPMTREGTLSPFATTHDDWVLAVGAAIDKNMRTRPALYASSGPTPGRPAPDCAAISDETLSYLGQMASGTFSGSTARLQGTSVAAPLVARGLADALASGMINKDTSAADAITAMGWPGNAVADRPQLGAATQPLTPANGRPPRRERP
ncbi:MAG: hypothetical protein AAGG54_16065 [Pseudomonadota bacterium]